MKFRYGSTLLAILAAIASPIWAQVTVAGVTRTSGLYTSSADIPEFKDVNRFLFTLESDLAGQVANDGKVRYQDRASTQELFRELRLSSSTSFDAGSGAVRGLLGRLDFLVVIDAIDGSSARMRLIDVENGSLRSVQTCHKRFSLLSSSPSPSDCIPIMARKIAEVAGPKAAEKSERRQKEAQAKREQTDQAANRVRELRAQHEADNTRLAKRADIARAEETKAKLDADAYARDEDKRRTQAAHELLLLKPSWDEACARLTSAQELWASTARHMAENGRTLRPEITSLLRAADADLQTGNQAMQNDDTATLRQVTSSMNGRLTKLDDYR